MKIDGYKRSEKYTYFLDNLAIFNNTRWTRGRLEGLIVSILPWYGHT
jgi:hypothetical protein